MESRNFSHKMKTEQQIRDKIKWLEEQIPNFDGEQFKILMWDIARLQWVVGDGPDNILVPIPKGKGEGER